MQQILIPATPTAFIEDVTFICVWIGPKYGREYVERLGKAIVADLAPWWRASLKCITDNVPAGSRIGNFTAVQAAPFQTQEEGCWQKLQCFNPSMGGGRKVYIDLDVVICGEIDGYIPTNAQTWLGAMKDPVRAGHFNSSVMTWNGADMQYMWELRGLRAKTGKQFGKPNGPWKGDQDFIREHLRGEWKPLDGVLSYKADLTPNKIPPRCRIAVFHGRPKMTDLETGNPYRQRWEK